MASAPATTTLDETKLTPEQSLELEKTRLERITAERDLLGEQQRRSQAESQQRELLSQQALKDAVIAGPRFYDAALVIGLAKSQFDLRFDEKGEGTGVVKGRRVPLADVFSEIATVHPTLVSDRRTLPKSAEPPVKARDQMSRAEKIDFIDRFGLSAWEKLPAHAMQTTEVTTLAIYSRLPVKIKTALLAKNGLAWLERLPRR